MSEYGSGDTKTVDPPDIVPDRRGESRRLHQRLPVHIDTILECGNILYKGAILDISKKGCRIATDNAIRNASHPLTITYIFPGELDARVVRGKIKWMEQKKHRFILGIEFEKPHHFQIG